MSSVEALRRVIVEDENDEGMERPPVKDDDRERGVTISIRTIVRTTVLIALVAAACAVAFLAGQGTRISEATAEQRTNDRIEKVNAHHKAELEASVDAALADAKRLEQKRVKGLNKMWRDRITRMKRKHERSMERAVENAREAGIDAGYATGSAAGYSSGKEEGVEEGIEKASDDLVCSDDPDVDLPPCWDW